MSHHHHALMHLLLYMNVVGPYRLVRYNDRVSVLASYDFVRGYEPGAYSIEYDGRIKGKR
jgi:hypothetical protein